MQHDSNIRMRIRLHNEMLLRGLLRTLAEERRHYGRPRDLTGARLDQAWRKQSSSTCNEGLKLATDVQICLHSLWKKVLLKSLDKPL